MSTREPYDIDADLGEWTTHPKEYADAWRASRARLGAWALVWRGALFSAVVVCGLVIVSWATGWAADAVARWLP